MNSFIYCDGHTIRKGLSNTASLLRNLLNKIDFTVLRPVLFRSVKLTAVNIVGVVLLFFTNNYLVKLLGEQDYGYYVIVNVWIQFFSVLVVVGMDDYFVATLPKFYFDSTTRKSTAAIFYWAGKVCFRVLLGLVGFLLIAMQAGYFPAVLDQNKLVFFLFLAALSFLLMTIAFFRGINEVLIGQVIEKLLRPAIIFLIVLALYWSQKSVAVQHILWWQVLVLIACIVVMMTFFWKRFGITSPVPIVFDRSLKKNATFLGISLLYMLSVRLDILFLTDTARSEDVGYYNIAARISDLVGYPLTAISLIAPTLLAKEFHQNKTKMLSLLRTLILLAVSGSVLGFLVVLIAGKSVLQFFGENFAGALWPLIILSSTHLLAAFALPMNTVLMVSNRQKAAFYCLCLNVSVTFFLCLLMVRHLQSTGAALAVLGGNFAYLVGLFFTVRINRRKLFS